jgi:hypothetical protein
MLFSALISDEGMLARFSTTPFASKFASVYTELETIQFVVILRAGEHELLWERELSTLCVGKDGNEVLLA